MQEQQQQQQSLPLERCDLHGRKQRFLCITCKVPLCSNCLITKEHSNHKIFSIDDIKLDYSTITHSKTKSDNVAFGQPFVPRLFYLWDMLQQLSFTYSTLDKSIKDVAEHFRQEHEKLRLEEHKMNSPIIEEFKKTRSTMSAIIKEVEDISILFKMVPLNSDDDLDCHDDGNDDSEIKRINTELVEFIKSSSTTLVDYMKKNFKPVTAREIEHLGDNELMALAQKRLQTINTPHRLTKALKATFTVKQSQSSSIFSYKAASNHCGIYSPETGKWTSIDVVGDNEQTNTFSAIVFACDNVYVFGGYSNPSYERYSLKEHRWYKDLPLMDDIANTGISVCFDGDSYIYLVGGHDNLKPSNQVHRFNVHTQQVESFGSIPLNLWFSFVAHHNGKLYILGGLYEDSLESKTLITFDIRTKKTNINNLDFNKSIYSCCFDGVDSLYYIEPIGFRQFSLSTMQAKALSLPSGLSYGYPIVYDPNGDQGTIYMLQGKGRNLKYSIKLNQWTTLKDDMETEISTWCGACLIPPESK
ncbi:hypothetical protein SAMD00019534_008140 [Acytostelium subglobosum LB1]|uniref:hypothetical protein n=1 Tax=Acytostelium subglobosum LB1 TaxID=1410327 RepID=UPI000644DECF|nr:hypothetical protein SAMD00019534_008140 [Acytostelium subglobosum LB1]GAM17639.1 hypothetical protein SAMD00019534_008140 [Acytostelium subglobosum LB1]|eukprot:XP_012758235.1 hypothetical protein SAMD00019534_008140 [Acytostelium subglobosum LB1]